MNHLLDFPDEILYRVLRYIAPPTKTVSVLCHEIAPLCSSARYSVFHSKYSLWSMILYEEYRQRKNDGDISASIASRMRYSKRIRISIIDEVKTAHEPVSAINNIFKCIKYPDDCIDIEAFRRFCRKYKKNLITNKKCLSTILVKCVREHWIHEDVGLECVRELIEEYGALVNLSFGSFEGEGGMTALYTASAFGMVNVVQYLLKKGASASITSTGRFSLYSDPSRSIYGTYTPLTLAAEMRTLELRESTFTYEFQFFDKVLRVLAEHYTTK